MPKAKLTGAVKAADATAEVKTTSASADGAGTTTTETDKGESSEGDADGDEADPEAAEDSESGDAGSGAENSGTAPEVNSLASYREVFGHTEGSVFFADKVDFGTACKSHIATLKAANVAQAAEIATLKATNATLAKEVHGSADPVLTGNKAEKTPGEKASAQRLGSEGKATYAASLDAKLAAL